MITKPDLKLKVVSGDSKTAIAGADGVVDGGEWGLGFHISWCKVADRVRSSAKPQGVYRVLSRTPAYHGCSPSKVPGTVGYHRVPLAYHENFDIWMKVPETVGRG